MMSGKEEKTEPQVGSKRARRPQSAEGDVTPTEDEIAQLLKDPDVRSIMGPKAKKPRYEGESPTGQDGVYLPHPPGVVRQTSAEGDGESVIDQMRTIEQIKSLYISWKNANPQSGFTRYAPLLDRKDSIKRLFDYFITHENARRENKKELVRVKKQFIDRQRRDTQYEHRSSQKFYSSLMEVLTILAEQTDLGELKLEEAGADKQVPLPSLSPIRPPKNPLRKGDKGDKSA